MSRIKPLNKTDLAAQQREALDRAEELLGFVSNDSLLMARAPAVMDAFSGLVAAVYKPGKVDPGLKRLIGLITSTAAGCDYCIGHTAYTSQRFGISEEKLADVWDFENSELYGDDEKAALRIAMLAGQSPNGVTDEIFSSLCEHFDDDACIEIVAVIAMFGFLNRWNSTLSTDLESLPRAALDQARKSEV